ncbi:MAG: GNAT family N-acetyltransferase [Thermoanaerobaculia bacterium]
MRIDTLASTPFATVSSAFDEAFGDYSVSFSPSATWLGEMMRRRGVRPELSVGVWEGDRLVAFTLNGLGTWTQATTGYDCGTGVVPDFRGRRLTSMMLAKTEELLRDAGASQYLLEVLQDNEKAIRAYRGAGFETTRELRCWSFDSAPAPLPAGIEISEDESLELRLVASMRDSEPSWQNSDESICRAGDPRVPLVAHDAGGVVGYAMLFPVTRDLAQIAVAGGARRRGIGRALLAAARARCGSPFRILNIDARDSGTNAFLDAVGATEIVRQFEMLKRSG